MFTASFVEGGLQHFELASGSRHRVYAAIEQITHSPHDCPVLPSGSARMSRGKPFDDAAGLDLDPQHPIVSVTIKCGPGIDGIT